MTKILIKLLHRIFILIENFLDILCSLISIFTLTLYRPNWDFNFLCCTSVLLINLRKKYDDSH
jgi:hypothetical protein